MNDPSCCGACRGYGIIAVDVDRVVACKNPACIQPRQIPREWWPGLAPRKRFDQWDRFARMWAVIGWRAVWR